MRKEKAEHEGKQEGCQGGLSAQLSAYLFLLKVSLGRTLCFPSGKRSALRQAFGAAILVSGDLLEPTEHPEPSPSRFSHWKFSLVLTHTRHCSSKTAF